MEDRQNFDLEQLEIDVKGLSLVDVSPGKVITEGSKEHTSNEFLEFMDAEQENGLATGINDDEQVPELLDVKEPDRICRNGRSNLRKSLAWDSAFFTSEGVLDANELSVMMKGAKEGVNQLLPCIEEDVHRSTDSISTLESENLAVERIEAELFGDIRASIQKFYEVPNMMSSSSSDISSKEEVDVASPDQPKPKDAFKKNIGARSIGMSKFHQKQTLGKQGSEKGLKQESGISHGTQPAVKIGGSNALLSRPPKISSRANSISATVVKKSSPTSSQVKAENVNAKNNTGAAKGTLATKISVPTGASRMLPKPAIRSKSSQTSSCANKSLSSSSSSSSSENTGKSPLPEARRKMATRVVNPASSGSTLKTPKSTQKNTMLSKNHNLSAHLMSAKIATSISPAGSISEWSSVSSSSSSSSTINLRFNKTRTSNDSSSCRSSNGGTPLSELKRLSNDQNSGGNEVQGTASPNDKIRKPLKQNGALPRPASVRPSGLRMPSPKMGFFDGKNGTKGDNLETSTPH